MRAGSKAKGARKHAPASPELPELPARVTLAKPLAPSAAFALAALAVAALSGWLARTNRRPVTFWGLVTLEPAHAGLVFVALAALLAGVGAAFAWSAARLARAPSFAVRVDRAKGVLTLHRMPLYRAHAAFEVPLGDVETVELRPADDKPLFAVVVTPTASHAIAARWLPPELEPAAFARWLLAHRDAWRAGLAARAGRARQARRARKVRSGTLGLHA